MTDSNDSRDLLTISLAHECSDDLLHAVRTLVPQLSSTTEPPDRAALQRIIESETTHLLLASIDGRIVGILTLAVFAIPTGIRAWIEDVVVDDNARGKGIGKALTLTAIDRARDLGARTVELTSRPGREAANRLYQRLGFVQRGTNVYRFTLDT